MAVGLKSAEERLILLFFRCDSTLHKPAIDDKVMKTHKNQPFKRVQLQ
jgi:hypothetical protein